MTCDCAEVVTPGLLDLFEARERLIAAARPVSGTETVSLEAAVGRVLAADVEAGLDLPGVDNSAMDGYALRLAELREAGSDGLPVALRVPAGAGVLRLPDGGCSRIFTGGPVPLGADAVVPQERTRLDGRGRLHVLDEVAAGANIRRRGEEARAGEEVMPAGTRLNAASIALLASHGIAEVTVRRRLRVALFATGDELVEPGQSLLAGQVYNSNAAMLRILIAQQQCEVIDLGVVVDNPDDLSQAFATLRRRAEADLVLCTGGVSVGEEDHVRPVLERHGGLAFHGVAMKPGKPVAFGWLGEKVENGIPLVGLPGNPVASLVGWQLLALPFVHARQGRRPAPLQRFPVVAGFSRRASRGRRELLRARLEWRTGQPVAVPAGGQGSHMLSAASAAHGYLMVEADTAVEKGDIHAFCPAAQFLD